MEIVARGEPITNTPQRHTLGAWSRSWRLSRGADGRTVRRTDCRTIDGELLSLSARVRPFPGERYEVYIYTVSVERSERLAGPLTVASLTALEALAHRISRGGRAAVDEIRLEGLRGVIA